MRSQPSSREATSVDAIFLDTPALDPRAPRGVRHPVVSVLAISVAAVLAGARAYTVIAEWAGEQPARVLAAFGVFGPVPSDSTIRRVLSTIDPSVLAAAVGAFVWTRTTVAAG